MKIETSQDYKAMLRPQLGLVIKNLEIQSSVLYDFLKQYLDRQLGLHRLGVVFSSRHDTRIRKFSILARVTEMEGQGL